MQIQYVGKRIIPPKVKFTKDDVLEAAIAVLNKEGFEAMSAAKVAKVLGSSPQPIYSHFKNFIDLKCEVIRRIVQKQCSYMNKEYSKNALVNLVMASVLFVKENKEYYIALGEVRGRCGQLGEDIHKKRWNQIRNDPIISKFPLELTVKLYRHMLVYQYGLTSLISEGLFDAYSPDDLKSQITEAMMLLMKIADDDAQLEGTVTFNSKVFT